MNDKSEAVYGFGMCTKEKQVADQSCHSGFQPICIAEVVRIFGMKMFLLPTVKLKNSGGFMKLFLMHLTVYV